MTNLSESARAFVLNQLSEVAREKGIALGKIEDDQNLLDLGILDSLGFVQMLMAMETELQLELDVSELEPEEFTTLEGLVTTATRSAKSI